MFGVAFFGDVDRGARATLQLGDRGALVPDDEPDEALLDRDGLEPLATHLHLVDDVGTARADHLLDHFLGFLDGFRRAANRHIADHTRRIHVRIALNLPTSSRTREPHANRHGVNLLDLLHMATAASHHQRHRGNGDLHHLHRLHYAQSNDSNKQAASGRSIVLSEDTSEVMLGISARC